ncbi:MAG: type 4a pilus biogenesis protein PilO [Candidatus Omnitrophica bacterium]|nr:type 4a pilus biogenesis protein PilO [Candidatus Omnitrophota bacterium]
MLNLSDFKALLSIDRKMIRDLSVIYGLAALLCFAFIAPSCSRADANKGRLTQKRADLTRGRARISESLRMQGSRDIYLDEIQAAESRFFREEEMSRLMGIVSEMAKAHKVNMTASKPVQEAGLKPAAPALPLPAAKPAVPAGGLPVASQTPEFYKEQKFEIELTGGYHSLGAFLSDLRKHPRIMHVRKLKVLGSPEGKREHEISLTLSVYSNGEVRK